MVSFALFRLPREHSCRLFFQKRGTPRELTLFTDLNGKRGFVIAPFAISKQQPLLLIEPDEQFTISTHQLIADGFGLEAMMMDNEEACQQAASAAGVSAVMSEEMERMRYSIDFANFHAHLSDGAFSKIVLARCSFRKDAGAADASASDSGKSRKSAVDLFREACRLYPRMFVALVSTPESGTWMMATPELLLDGKGTEWRTIALAGTQKLTENQMHFDSFGDHDEELEKHEIKWDDKNKQEQRYVATYITECLEQFSHRMEEEGPYTVRAANLVHLRSDFRFQLDDNTRIGTLLKALHPTPAVCGLPKDETFDFIVRNESFPRSYYSGFLGPLDPDGGTHLYVSLRCMRILKDGYRLYAGGGLLKDSVEQQEWAETEAKMETMLALINAR